MIWPRWAAVASLFALTKSIRLTPCGPSTVPTGGAGVACPAGSWILTVVSSFFLAIEIASVLLNVVEAELHGRVPAEDVDEDHDLLLVDVDLLDDPVEVGEWAGDHAHLLADLPLRLEPGLGLLFLFLDAEEPLDLAAGEWCRLLGVARDETRHAGGVAHGVPGVVVEDHPDQEVAGEDLARHGDLAASLELDHVLHGDVNLEDLVLHVHGLDAGLEVGLDLVLVPRVGVDHVPVAGEVVRAEGPGLLLRLIAGGRPFVRRRVRGGCGVGRSAPRRVCRALWGRGRPAGHRLGGACGGVGGGCGAGSSGPRLVFGGLCGLGRLAGPRLGGGCGALYGGLFLGGGRLLDALRLHHWIRCLGHVPLSISQMTACFAPTSRANTTAVRTRVVIMVTVVKAIICSRFGQWTLRSSTLTSWR